MRRTNPGENSPDDKKGYNYVAALARGLELMRCFGDAAEYLGNAELAARTGIPRPTVSRLTATLTQLGYLIYVDHLERYRLGPKVLDLGYRYLASEGVGAIAQPFMQEFADATNCFVAIGVADGTQMAYTTICQGQGPLILRTDVGSRVGMAYTAIGRAYLSGLDTTSREICHELLRRDNPDEWPAAENRLQAAYAQYERDGFCVSEGEWNRDISAVGVPLILESGHRVVALNCSGSSLRLTKRVLTENLGPRLQDLVEHVRELLEGRRAPA